MTRSDIGVIAIIYATCLWFAYMTFQLKASAQIYPLCLIAGLAILNTLYLGRCLLRLVRARAEGGQSLTNDIAEVFREFQPRQFFFVVLACLVYMALLHYIGFYPAGLIYLVGVMWGLKVKPAQLCVATLVLGALVYGVFTLFLKVPLPKGALFS